MAERDAWWSIFLHYQCEAHEAVDSLVEWAWSLEDKSILMMNLYDYVQLR